MRYNTGVARDAARLAATESMDPFAAPCRFTQEFAMKHWILSAAVSSALCSMAWTAHAASWGDNLRQQLPPLGNASPDSSANNAVSDLLGSGAGTSGMLSSLGVPAAGTASNAAGVITYCVKNNYIQANKNKAEQVKDQLLGKLGMKKQETPKDTGYLNGLAGKITGKDGKSFSLDQLKGDLKTKACDFVLDNATSLL